MKIVIAPDSYKESLSALEVATQIEKGFREVFPDADYVKLPVADGGEGTVEAMVAATGGEIIRVQVTGPLGKPVEAFFGLSGDRTSAFIEMAAASGLELVRSDDRNPLLTTSYGTGELIRCAPVCWMTTAIPSASAAVSWRSLRASTSAGWMRASAAAGLKSPATSAIR